ncbi:probable ubiquitin carboxyl-terminal hydrolase MINDY-4 isoform X2 [Pezoporus wallicus]|uniref:probable ubiquitin carboxyl-terminal hydrolase MINDY-4 isoform X2 n=1 Tax=Pezoporus wallicus TaxID=35540 RepID=UPI00254C0388|nr:probable ubiquitin carboxyl-terminal hydrolase MINDY-4 isoform X2 [Pezoporus wallicus]XP_061330472.1 probable ubiquitin carboxyl-terminal hydrolase MINDY-4 isoform X2 [Pezoporus flaviventris]
MENSFVEEVAASLIREFLSRKGLKKTITTMDQELPRSELSINNRNELRNVLHLHSLYKHNKAKENPLKTLLEIITNYFLEHRGTSRSISSSSALSAPQSKSSTSHQPNLSDEDHMCGSATTLDESRTQAHRKHQHKSEKCPTGAVHNSQLLSDGDKKLQDSREDLKAATVSEELKSAVKEKPRPRSSLIVRGMMAGPVASSPEDLQKRRLSKRSTSISSTAQFKAEEHEGNDLSVPGTDFQESKGSSAQVNIGFTSKVMSSLHTSSAFEKLRTIPKDTDDSFASALTERERTKTEERKSLPSFGTDSNEKSLKVSAPHRHSGAGREKRERSFKKNESRLSGHRRSPTSTCCKEDQMKDVLELVDVEAEETTGEVIKNPDLSTLYMLQVVSKAIDISLAKELKNLLFGSSLCCFSEEWKIQNFTFNNIPQLKYGIVQKKGGPCGVLAAVQACVLQRLIFADSNRNKDIRCLQPSEVHRTKCLTMAIADILWRAGGNEKAIVALPSGRQQFIPIGKYKADGILETLILHSATRYEDLVVFLQQNIHQFETGPCGCILLTVSVILSRSINLVRNDFDVLTNRLIGSHGYCTQELVNLLLTGKAVSNVFNNVIELDSGNGNITILKGITSRSDIGLLSLFEHYDVCQVGCYLKTPKYPIWLVCSESHFSVLFSLEKDLQGDWKTERKFDLYYYDGLANQEEEIRLTVDTTQMCAEDKENDLTPPLEHCIRTKWQGAVIDWNGTEPIL